MNKDGSTLKNMQQTVAVCQATWGLFIHSSFDQEAFEAYFAIDLYYGPYSAQKALMITHTVSITKLATVLKLIK